MTEEQLYAAKGRLTMQIEVAQAQLQQVNKQLIEMFNQKSNGAKPVEEKVEA